jgi:RNA polymerase sigma-70 factor, ECF subfamily
MVARDVMQPYGDVTDLLAAFRNGEREAGSRLAELTYRELRKIAAGHMRRERSARSIQATDLVHEAYMRLFGQAAGAHYRDRAHFFQIASHIMRQVLIDRARKRRSDKRGGDVPQISLDRALDFAEARSADLLLLDDALNRLKSLDARQCQIVELRFFGGMSEDEIAELLGVSTRTVNREWRLARAWLYGQVYR